MAVQVVEPKEIVLAQRPKEAGKQGKAVQLVTNFFKANFSQVPPIMHHDIRVERMQFDPETGPIHPHLPAHSHLPTFTCELEKDGLGDSAVSVCNVSFLLQQRRFL